MQWTKMQETAVKAPLGDILVTAAAGSGKTQVLTGRILHRIREEAADISRMLIITFTNAAASEMRSRISSKIAQAVSEDPSNKRLGRQLALVGSADISTIHSFCLKVLRSYFYLIGLDPAFRMAKEYDVKIMKAEALSEAMDAFYESGDAAFLSLIDRVCGAKNDASVAVMAEKICAFAESDPFPLRWLAEAEAAYDSISEEAAPFSDILMARARENVESALLHLRKALSIAENAEGLEGYAAKFAKDVSAIENAYPSACDWDSLRAMLSYEFESRPSAKKTADPVLKEQSLSERNIAKELFKTAGSYLTMPFSKALSYSAEMKEVIRALLALARKAMELYDEKKAERNLLDFSDLEHKTIEILTKDNGDGTFSPSEAAMEIRDRYDEIYVDEYQDTNDVQETILSMISSVSKGRPNLFMVGDMKQSIYRFRMTNPREIFGAKADSFTDVEQASPGDLQIKISLSKNFRSRPELLDAINFVFDSLMSRRAGEIAYTGGERLEAGSPDYTQPSPLDAPMNIRVLTAPYKTPIDERRKRQCDYLSERIHTLIRSKVPVFDKEQGTFRPIAYRDIVILLRSPKSVAPIFKDGLLRNNIPVFTDAGYNFYESVEIQLFLELLRIIDNPLQDISLVCVLRSPLFGFNENQLAHLSLFNRPTLYQALCEAAKADDDAGAHCRYFLGKLSAWRNEASLKSVTDLLYYLIADTNYTSYIGTMEDSETHKANLHLLIHLAQMSDQSAHSGLFNFLRYIDKLFSTGGDDMRAAMPNPGINAVRIMSIHRSKGLEFPFVFLCCSNDDFSTKDMTGHLLLHKKMGLGLNAFLKERATFQLPMNRAIASLIHDETVSEELRILYVALTRAREHVEVLACVALGKNDDHYIRPEPKDTLSPTEVLAQKNYFDWLMMLPKNEKLIHVDVLDTSSYEEAADADRSAVLYRPEPRPCTEEFRSILEFRYPFADIASVKNKYSVSELKYSLFQDEETMPYPALFQKESLPQLKEPSFLNLNKVFTSAQKGSIMHYVMQHLPLVDSGDALSETLDALSLSERERMAVDETKLAAFLATPLYKRMCHAKTLHRESSFTFKKRLSDITGNPKDRSDVLIQGIIDCWFIEEDGTVVLLDYKTDKNADASLLRHRYALQLALYAEALERKLGTKVREKYIYTFDRDKLVEM